jgi:HK97 family phage prohead protease
VETLRDLDLIRGVPAHLSPLQLRADAEPADALGRLVVRFSPFNVWYEVSSWWEGNFLEQTQRGAFKKTMKESKNSIRALFDHGYDPQIGNKVLAATEDLREDPDSAVLEGDLLDTSYNHDLAPGLRAGVYGSSFRFRVIQESWNDDPGVSDHNPKGIPERVITEIKLFEAGPVTFPANPEATAGVRSLTDQYYERLRGRNPQRYDELLARARSLRTPEQAAATGTAEPTGAARTTDGEPQTHSLGYTPAQRRALLFPILEGARQ